MIKILKSEFYKVKHTWLPLVHIILPTAYALIFFAAAKTTGLKNYPRIDIIQNYFVIAGAVFPIIIGAITSKSADMEASAGNFQMFLSSTESRAVAYTGKLLALLIGAMFSISVSAAVFDIIFTHQNINELMMEILLIFAGCIPLYIIHLWVSIKINAGASLALGFAETLIALISITGLGDKIWYFIPAAWSARLAATYTFSINYVNNSILYSELLKWGLSAVLITTVLYIFSVIWIKLWDGKSFCE